MRNLARFVLMIGAAALFAGCGGSQSPIGAPGAMPQSRATPTRADRGGSWILSGATSGNLIYAVGGCGGICILSYPKGKLDGAIPGYIGHYFEATCSDANGNVYVSDNSQVLEFSHGGTAPIATFNLPGTQALGCTVDPLSGNLAVVFNVSKVAIFAPDSSTPAVYGTQLEASYCGYDNAGNLFVDGFVNQGVGISELKAGSGSFQELSVDQSVGEPGQIQWDGKHLSYEAIGTGEVTISRLAVSGSVASIVGQTTLNGVRRRLQQSWIYNGSAVAPYGNHGPSATNIGIWKYPRGGSATKRITKFSGYNKKTFSFYGATISVAPSR